MLLLAEPDSPARFLSSAGLDSLPRDFNGACFLFEQDRAVLRLDLKAGQPTPARAQAPGLVRRRLHVWAHSRANLIAIRDNVANLNLILNGLNPAGVVFDLAGVSTPPAAAWDVIGHNCRNEHAVRESQWYRPDAVNVYYHGVPDTSARCCLAGDVVFLGPAAQLGLLAHELGHSLGLRGDSDGSGISYDDGHTDSPPPPNPFTKANIMWRGDITLRHHLTLGQIAWMHSSSRSILTAADEPDAPLPPWSCDPPERRPDPLPEDRSRALATRYQQILAYWDNGRRPEGRPGSTSTEEFLRLHCK